jgi:hypothetical protein
LFFTNKLQLQVSHILWCLPFKLVNCWHMCLNIGKQVKMHCCTLVLNRFESYMYVGHIYKKNQRHKCDSYVIFNGAHVSAIYQFKWKTP